ncbi:MAG TPA: MarR family winged helix-turn-helix transcriptional regulator [Candidatus Eisenbacteria bacterium]|nr:MarR family winged helix-turn-helix transcriptional regulator [Candidatus Eisenbacteria bacterium]
MQEIEDATKACVCGNLRKASRSITQFYDKLLAPSGITITQLALLRIISIGNSSTISKLSKDMYMDRTTLTRNLDLLKKQDLIKIESSSDKRKRIVTMTNRGKAQMTKALPLWERAQGTIIEKFGKGNWREINTGLNEISNIARFN